MFAAKMHDDTKIIKGYSEQLLAMIRKEFSKRNINLYDYERFINILTCLNLQTNRIKEDLDCYINKKTYRHMDIKL